MKQIFNRGYLKKARRDLRKNLTPAEATLWLMLKNKQLEGRRFRRQFSIGNFIVDFYCPSEKLVIELDGANHFTNSGSNADFIRD
jgi:very-short-patch-repair endonuclease